MTERRPASASTLIVMPTYNEIENLQSILDAIHEAQPEVHVLVVDDNSPDGTGQVAQARAERDARVFVLHRTAKNGLGAAYLAGFAWALDRGYARVIEMDADFSHDPRYLAPMLDASDHADVVVGSRNVEGGGTVGWPWYRNALSKGGSLYARTVLQLPVRDVTAGFVCWRREALRALDLASVESNGYVFQVELKARAHHAGLRIVEVPIQFPDRQAGLSKMHAGIAQEAVIQVLRLRWRLWRQRRSPRV